MIPSRRPATPGSISKQPYSTNKNIQEKNRHVEIQLWLTALVEGKEGDTGSPTANDNRNERWT